LTERAIWIAHGWIAHTCPTLGVERRRLALDKQDLVRVGLEWGLCILLEEQTLRASPMMILNE